MTEPSKPSLLTVLDRKMWGPFLGILKLPQARRAGLEERIQRLEDDRAIRDLHLEYTYCYDAGDVAGSLRPFHKDCRLVNPRGTYVGIKAIEENYRYLIERRRYSFHNTSNIVVRISEDGKEAVMTAFLQGVAVQHSGVPVGVAGTYCDRLIKTEEGWRIIERRITSNIRHYMAVAPQLNSTVAPPPKATEPEGTQDWIGSAAIL